MNKAKISLFALATVLAVGSAFASAKRAIRVFYQPTPGAGQTWKLLTAVYDEGNCFTTNNTYCVYTLANTAVVPTNPTSAQLQSAGAIGHDANKKYILP